MSLDKQYTFKSYECPFCSEGHGGDGRSLHGTGVCNHTFTASNYSAYLQGIKEYEAMVKDFKAVARKMRRVIDKSTRVRKDSHKN